MNPIKDRIIKLLAAATSDNEHEATLAMTMAQTLMDKHNLSIAELSPEESKSLEEDVIADGDPLFHAGRISSWKFSLAGVLARANGCRILKWSHEGHKLGGQRGSAIRIYGRPSDIAMVRFMLAYAVTQLSRFAPTGQGKTYANSWYLGAVRGIQEKLEAAKKVTLQTASTYALVKLDNRAAAVDKYIESNMKVRTLSAPKLNIDSNAYNAGFQKGRNMDLNEKSRLKANAAIGMK